MKKSKAIATFTIDQQTHSVRATGHALQRMEERKVSAETALSAILALQMDKVNRYKETQEDVAIIDKQNDCTIIVSFNSNKIEIITVIDNSNVWLKDGTKIERLVS